MDKKQTIFVTHVNAHQSVTSTKEDFNNQVDSMNHFVDISHPLSPATHSIAQWTHKTKWSLWKVIHGFRDMTSTPQG